MWVRLGQKCSGFDQSSRAGTVGRAGFPFLQNDSQECLGRGRQAILSAKDESDRMRQAQLRNRYNVERYTMRITIFALTATVGLLMFTTPIAAHHAFAAEFSADKPITLKGTVTEMEWINPHSWIHIDVKKPDGSVESWGIEGGTPNTLYRRGLNKKSLPPGLVILVEGYQAKDGSWRVNGRDITLENGQKFFLGSSGTGAPYDGRGRGGAQR